MIAKTRRIALAALAGLLGCGGGAPSPSTPQASAQSGAANGQNAQKGTATPLVAMVKPSFLVPDFDAQIGTAELDGSRRILSERMRLIVHDDGAVERAAELLPFAASAIELPSRLGGGFVFYANTGGGTQIWRAPTWLADLEPLVQIGSVTSQIIPGFDRLYLRLQSTQNLTAIHPETGALMGLGPLPLSAAYGPIAFADGWRAVVDTDLRGPLVTFDAGSTWSPLGLSEKPRDISVTGGDPSIQMPGGRYLIDVHGNLTFRVDEAPSPSAHHEGERPAPRPTSALGKRPLRAAVEDGWPDSPTTAIVARGGALARISLKNGALLAQSERAYPESLASCHAIPLGHAFGFICGESEGPTTVYAPIPHKGVPLVIASPPEPAKNQKPGAKDTSSANDTRALPSLQAVMRFAKPRLIASSGNGAIVVRGGCTDETNIMAGTHAYCIRDKAGKIREIRVKGSQSDLGSERVVALSDGRVAVLIPPKNGGTGQLTLLKGNAATSVALHLPTSPRSVARELRRGMWLEGFEERDKGALGGWVEAGGPILGVRISLDGKVTAGELRNDAGGAILSGRFALSLGEVGMAIESTDGGMSWNAFEMPERDPSTIDRPQTRACGPVGCVLGGWIRVGWGEGRATNDLRPARPPQAPYVPLKISSPLSLRCELGPSATPPLPSKEAKASPPPPPPRTVRGRYGMRFPMPRPGPRPRTKTGWIPFRNTPPPTLASDEIGIDNGPYADLIQMRTYAWGKKGADWSRTGRWLIRFDDRFDPTGGVRSSALTTSLWSNEDLAAEAIGVTSSYGATSWGAYLDPSGRAALAIACRHSSMGCTFYAAAEGQPVLPIRGEEGQPGVFQRPYPNGAVRVGGAWFFLTQGPSAESVALHRVDLGVARRLAIYYRPTRYGLDSPRMIRRALSNTVGILVSTGPEPGERYGSYYVLPVDPDSGELGEAMPLGRRDFASGSFDKCAPGQDGWLFDAMVEPRAVIDVIGGYGTMDGVEARVRMDPGSVCIERLAARSSEISTKTRPGAPKAKPRAPSESDSLPLAATERTSGKRYLLTCENRRR